LECPKELPLFDKKNDHPTISVRLVNNKLQHISIVRDSLDNEKLSYYGYFLSFKNDNLHIYAEGDIPLKITNYYDATIKDNTKLNNLSIDGKGIEIKFHPNGFPASYKSIVKNRLYGRQIEWDDKGEIVSDVDLDIPKEWKDAPKENKSQPK
jgi:antitoxin component YwqK of YwqJK toxin-antitoxin module